MLRQKLARALFFLDKPNDAFSELTQAAKDDATLEPAAVTMGRLWTEKGDVKKAREWLDRAIKADSNSMCVHLAFTNGLLQQNEIDQAKIHADAAALLKPDDADVMKLQGLIARVQKDFAAERIFRLILNDAPGDFFASDQLALFLADQPVNQQRQRALQFADVNARVYPRSAEALATLGYVRYRNGDLDGAMQALQKAVNSGGLWLPPLWPSPGVVIGSPEVAGFGRQPSADTVYYLALVYADQDKTKEAQRLLKAALGSKELFVYRKEAQALLDKLDKK